MKTISQGNSKGLWIHIFPGNGEPLPTTVSTQPVTKTTTTTIAQIPTKPITHYVGKVTRSTFLLHPILWWSNATIVCRSDNNRLSFLAHGSWNYQHEIG